MCKIDSSQYDLLTKKSKDGDVEKRYLSILINRSKCVFVRKGRTLIRTDSNL